MEQTMIRPFVRPFACVVAFVFCTTTFAQAPKITHEFACCDYTGSKVFLVNAEGAITWENKAPSSNDLWVLPNGNLLFTTGHGVLELTRDKKEVFKYESKSEIYACQRLPDGNTFVGECNAGRLLEVDPAGKIVKEVRLLPQGKDGGHLYMRNARRLADGHFLVAHYGAEIVREYDADGNTVAEFKAPGGPHSVARLPNGNTLISLADMKKDAKVVEYDKDGKLVWEVSNKDLPDAPLKFIAGIQRLPNGNTMLCNWLGHGQLGKAPHLLEVTPDKKVVWTYANHKDMKTISTIQVLEVGGDALKGEVQH
jgi:hypothetical protein